MLTILSDLCHFITKTFLWWMLFSFQVSLLSLPISSIASKALLLIASFHLLIKVEQDDFFLCIHLLLVQTWKLSSFYLIAFYKDSFYLMNWLFLNFDFHSNVLLSIGHLQVHLVKINGKHHKEPTNQFIIHYDFSYPLGFVFFLHC